MKDLFIEILDEEYLQKQRIAGKAVAKCLQVFSDRLKNDFKPISLKDIEAQSLSIIHEFNAVPTFLNYKGFPGAVCLSVNEHVVHGIPTDYVLKPGDVVTLDLGATYEGAIADAAFTCIYGQPKNHKHIEMIKLCQLALNNAIQAIKVDNRVGCIGAAIWNTVKGNGFALVDDYGGHSIDGDVVHGKIFVSNKDSANNGPRIQAGMSLAIEPILIMGKSNKTRKLLDDWTIVGKDISCHVEHTTFIHEDHVEIITQHGLEA